MATDYFAHAVYGIAPGGEDQAALNTYCTRSGPPVVDVTDEDEGRVGRKLQTSALAKRLRSKYHAPSDTRLFLVDYEDEHPGRSATYPGTWLIGYSMLSFPRDVSPGIFRGNAIWYTWVTASG